MRAGGRIWPRRESVGPRAGGWPWWVLALGLGRLRAAVLARLVLSGCCALGSLEPGSLYCDCGGVGSDDVSVRFFVGLGFLFLSLTSFTV